MSDAELAALSETEIDTLMNTIFGKEASGLFNRQFKNPLSLDNPVLSKIKDSKIKDFFSAETLKKIPKYLWNNTVGHMVGELKHSLHLKALPFTGDGLGKLEVFRTMYTGRSSGGSLNRHVHDGHSNWMLGGAWAPSAGTLATVGLVSVGEVYANHSDDIRGVEDMINQYRNNSEFIKNYIQWIYLGWLGTLIIEAPEALGLTKESL